MYHRVRREKRREEKSRAQQKIEIELRRKRREERGQKEVKRKIENSKEMRIERSTGRGNRRDGRDKMRKK